MKQKSLKDSFSLSGKGLHTGLDITVTFNPAPENFGYKIKRVDLPNQPIIDAVAEAVCQTQRGTVVKKGDAFCQGMFIKYLKTDDDESFGERVSGLGSTNKEV